MRKRLFLHLLLNCSNQYSSRVPRRSKQNLPVLESQCGVRASMQETGFIASHLPHPPKTWMGAINWGYLCFIVLWLVEWLVLHVGFSCMKSVCVMQSPILSDFFFFSECVFLFFSFCCCGGLFLFCLLVCLGGCLFFFFINRKDWSG